MVVTVILNLKHLNKSIEKIHFKTNTLQCAIAPMKKDCYFASFDIKHAYLLLFYPHPLFVDTYRPDITVMVDWALKTNNQSISSWTTLLRFKCRDQLFEFQCLPQGFRDAPR